MMPDWLLVAIVVMVYLMGCLAGGTLIAWLVTRGRR